MSAPIGLILGTGWNGVVQNIQPSSKQSFSTVFGKTSGVPGHEGSVTKGVVKGKECIILSGRFHTYEGYNPSEVVQTIEYLDSQGVKKIIITAACGGLNPKYNVGDVVVLSDLLTLFCQSPLVGAKFQDMSRPFSSALVTAAERSASETHLPYQKGVYAYFRGPHFESYADKMALKMLGADVCGMSTVPEVIMANHLRMETLGLALVTNLAFVKHSHEEVLTAAKNSEETLTKFIETLITHV